MKTRQVFVVGSPRSGTTLIGNFVATHRACAHLGEFFGFYSTTTYLGSLMRRVQSPVKEQYLTALVDATMDFVERHTKDSGKRFWCDQTPFNALAIEKIRHLYPDAVFVVMLRHYSGAIQSLQRSFQNGYSWAGQTIGESAEQWARFYRCILTIPETSSITVSYDNLCARPQHEITTLTSDLAERLSIEPAFDAAILAASYATESARQTIATLENGRVCYRAIASVDVGAWSAETESLVFPYVSEVNGLLVERYGALYVDPLLPAPGV